MIKFSGGEWFCIAGRGNVYATEMPETTDSLYMKEVEIEGHVYLVTGVEITAINDRTLYKGRNVGLLVRGVRKDK